MDRNISILTEKTAELRNVVEKSSSQETFDVDEAVVPTAPLYKQYDAVFYSCRTVLSLSGRVSNLVFRCRLLTAFAEESALEDAMYYVGEALRRNVIDLDVFLKVPYVIPHSSSLLYRHLTCWYVFYLALLFGLLQHTRELSRKQFMQRALILKCRERAGLP